jgi:predicted kinase
MPFPQTDRSAAATGVTFAEQRVNSHGRIGDDRVMPTTPVLLLVTGPPGTGKSTLADHAAEVLGGPVLGWDWAMAALTPFEAVQEALRSLPATERRRVGWSVLWNLATAQLRRGCSVVLDGVARPGEIEETRALAAAAGATAVVVVTSCRDVDVHRSRIEGRRREIPGWHELEWDHVADLLTRWVAPADADLYLDAVDPLAENLDSVDRELRRAGFPDGG